MLFNYTIQLFNQTKKNTPKVGNLFLLQLDYWSPNLSEFREKACCLQVFIEIYIEQHDL